ncbi:EthD family reductase [Hazenella sp. IB182357]|uniref:EthD family reductase n=1 Tax=Polycladospora coralii TaxID=2771432 RepID=A0A926N7W6_9BACL|nr:EthD family reductase [Polycladospora coralii]MBD1373616.1 EthD family reductase [Polycladospora coralii]MBS7529658.1 EthD family reductase [Polycladospora coralii]
MIKTTALYKDISNQEEFIQFYTETFLPHLMSVPGVVKVKMTRLVPSPFENKISENEAQYFLQCETYYESAEAFEQALKTPEGIEAAQCILEVASHFMTTYVGDETTYYNKSE